MATKQQHTYAILNTYNSGPRSDNSRVSPRLVKHFMDMDRAKLIKIQLDDADQAVSKMNYQTFCMSLELSNQYDCNCIPSDVSCKLLRSTSKLPKEIVSKLGSTIQVKRLDGRLINQGSPEEMYLAQYSLISSDVIKYFIEDSYLFIYGSTVLPTVIISGLWAKPDSIATFDCYSDDASSPTNPCYDPDNDEYPIDEHLVQDLYAMVKKDLADLRSFPEDTRNDAMDVRIPIK